ncbi:MAG: plastoquinol--plastocyanin reductase [Acidobacteria bacterium]|nr:MAG: plastoquinol--plastocyanin reductase [Acidobacteriota bacterium]
MERMNKTTRRSFLDYLLGTSVGAVVVSICYPVLSFLTPPRVAESADLTVVAGKVKDIPPNSGRIFKFGSRAALLVRTPAGEIRAFSATCTHLDCTVQYRDDLRGIWCACHDGHYDLQGRNVSGPPPRPLEQFKVNVRGDEIVVSRG